MEYELIRSKRRTLAAEIRGGRLIVRAPLRCTKAEIRAFLQKHSRWIETHIAPPQEDLSSPQRKLSPEQIQALVVQAKAVIPARVAYFAPLVGVDYGRITIRSQHTKWGSCSGKGNLNLNCLLMLAPPEVLDSVIVHELCHRKQMNHSPAFYAEVLRVFPSYPAQKLWLKQHGQELMALLPEKT